MSKIFIIMGSENVGGPRESWVLSAYTDEKKAKEVLANLQATLAMDKETARIILRQVDPWAANAVFDLYNLDYDLIEVDLQQ